MILGIVGSEAAKFTALTEQAARLAIRQLLMPEVACVVSGACHLGGIDAWAVEEAAEAGIPYVEHEPQALEWTTGYKPRNLRIVRQADRVVCITVRRLPPNYRYRGLTFDWCYHCRTGDHVKSGGCWTMQRAKKIGKQTQLIII